VNEGATGYYVDYSSEKTYYDYSNRYSGGNSRQREVHHHHHYGGYGGYRGGSGKTYANYYYNDFKNDAIGVSIGLAIVLPIAGMIIYCDKECRRREKERKDRAVREILGEPKNREKFYSG